MRDSSAHVNTRDLSVCAAEMVTTTMTTMTTTAAVVTASMSPASEQAGEVAPTFKNTLPASHKWSKRPVTPNGEPVSQDAVSSALDKQSSMKKDSCLKDGRVTPSDAATSSMLQPAATPGTSGAVDRVLHTPTMGAKVRDLQAWSSDAGGNEEASLGNGKHNDAPWDQFKANRDLHHQQGKGTLGNVYHLDTPFDESQYTTALDRTSPDYKKAERRAARLAREITKVSVRAVFERIEVYMCVRVCLCARSGCIRQQPRGRRARPPGCTRRQYGRGGQIWCRAA